MKKIELSKKNIIILVISVIFLFILCIGILFYTEINGSFRQNKDVEVSIKSGDNFDAITKKLSESGLVGNKFIFKIYSKFDSNVNKIKAGEFVLKSNSSYRNILNILSNNSNNLSKKITIIEGDNLISISKKLSEQQICSEEEFLNYVNKEYGFEFEKYVTNNNLKLFRNEGFVYPDTYHFSKDVSVEDVCKSMLSNFNKKMKPEYYDKAKEIGYSFEQIITLASIIQKEASNFEDMKMVSGVFWNRLRKDKNDKLQSDVTVFYARDIVGKRTNNDEMVTAYSTYLSPGIPVGPICSPSINAIEAALYPSESDYFYFLTDLNGKFYYAKTFDEHLKNDKIANEVNKNIKK